MKNLVPIILIAGVAVVFFGSTKRINKVSLSNQTIAKSEAPATTPLAEATNSEGNLKLVGMAQKIQGGGNSYVFKVIDTQKKTEIQLYDTIADSGSSISIPLNSWSPDYKQVFIKTSSPSGEDYFLFKASGESYADGKKYIAVGDYWNETKTTNKIDRITGWAGPDLLMVYTTKEDGTEGPAYWFVTSTRKFMQVREF